MIKSSFKKVEKATVSQKAYFGHPDIDAIFHNTLSKGHLFMLQEDHPTTHYISILRYFVSSQYNKSQPTLIYDGNQQRWKHLVSPPTKKSTKSTEKQEKTNQGQPQKKSQIAWRYDSQQINLNSLVRSQQVQQIDLSKQIPTNTFKENLVKVQRYPSSSLKEFYKSVQQNYIGLLQDQKDTKLKKLLFVSLPAFIYTDPQFNTFLRSLRCLARSSHMMMLITVPPIISTSVRNQLLKYSDYYFQIDKVSQGYKDFNGSLKIIKQMPSCTIRSQYRGQTIWGIKNRKRQLVIQSLYEQAVQEDESQQTTNSKPLCSQQDSGNLDF